MADLDKLYSVIEKEKGCLDILFANAAIGSFTALGSITEKYFDDIFNVKVKGELLAVQKALPIFVDGGPIIMNGSVSAVKAYPGASVYAAGMAALRSFARCRSVDLKERQIRMNIVDPGPIDIPALRRVGNSEEEKKMILAGF